MKKSILTILLALTIWSCSNDEKSNCETEKQSITEKYNTQIQYVKDNPGPNGIDYRQITLLQQQRDKKISEACN